LKLTDSSTICEKIIKKGSEHWYYEQRIGIAHYEGECTFDTIVEKRIAQEDINCGKSYNNQERPSLEYHYFCMGCGRKEGTSEYEFHDFN